MFQLNKSIDMVVVTYYPDKNFLVKNINSISNQIRKIYIIDNTPNKDIDLNELKSEKIDIIYLNENKGIAYAQNIGIKKSIQNKADYILLSDQDTIYPKDYILKMIKIFDLKEKIAAVSPKFYDITTKKEQGFIKNNSNFFKQFFPKEGVYEVKQVIASGKILNVKYLNEIGLMNEELFIDWVDFEWCWRAKKKGYTIIGNADVLIKHKLGDKVSNRWYKDITLRSPIRHYYITRNAVYLALYNNDLTLLEKCVLFFKSFRYIVGFPLLSKPHYEHFKYVTLGFFHGIIGKLGKYDG